MISLQNVKQNISAIDEKYQSQLMANIAIIHPQKAQKTIKYTMTGSGCRQNAKLLSLPIFRASICAAFLALQNNLPISIMITASHNPGNDNGIKIGYASQKVIQKQIYANIEKALNSKQSFEEYINIKIRLLEQKKRILCFVGRDTRKSSPELSEIVLKAFQVLQIRLVDIGICTTPELFSFSKYLLQNNINGDETHQKISLLKQKYAKQTLNQFQNIYKVLISKQLKKKKILLDFSNGSGAISIVPYKQTLNKYFMIDSIFDKQLDNPNFQCGADYTYRNWSIVLQQKYQHYNELIFFDGDSDRIILKVQQSDKCFDGNYFLMLYIKTILKILNRIQNESKIRTQGLNVNAVFTYMINQGVKNQLRQMGMQYIVADVGIQNLYFEAINNNKISVFFQPNGHGGVYFNEQILSKIKQLIHQHPHNIDLKILLSFHKILKNNSRGYGLHNMLMFFICKNYLQLKSIQDLFKVARQTSQNIYIKLQFDNLFRNGKQRNNQLIQPIDLVAQIDKIGQNNIGYPIIIRKSATEKGLIRVQIQGVDLNQCQQISSQITTLFKNGGYLKLQHQTSH